MAGANLALRFLLELAGIAAVAFWGWQVGGSGVTRWALAIGAPAALIVVWAVAIAPAADNPIPALARVLLGSAVLLLAAGALAMAGQPVLGVALAVLVAVNTLLMLVLGG